MKTGETSKDGCLHCLELVLSARKLLRQSKKEVAAVPPTARELHPFRANIDISEGSVVEAPLHPSGVPRVRCGLVRHIFARLKLRRSLKTPTTTRKGFLDLMKHLHCLTREDFHAAFIAEMKKPQPSEASATLFEVTRRCWGTRSFFQGAETSRDLLAYSASEDFEAAKKWMGARAGFVFKRGRRGTGGQVLESPRLCSSLGWDTTETMDLLAKSRRPDTQVG